MTSKTPYNIRIPAQNIVKGKTPVVEEGGVELMFLKPSEVIIRGKNSTTDTEKFLSSTPLAFDVQDTVLPEDPNADTSLTGMEAAFDFPSITDLENISFEEYYDPIKKAKRIKATLKIRNSSANKSNVISVDARIDATGISL
jgi:hypothetical protein